MKAKLSNSSFLLKRVPSTRALFILLFCTHLTSIKANFQIHPSDSIKVNAFILKADGENSLGAFDEEKMFLDSAEMYLGGNTSNSLRLKLLLARIRNSLKISPTNHTEQLMMEALRVSERLPSENPLVLKLKVRKAAFELIKKGTSSDSTLLVYEALLPLVQNANEFALETELLGRMALIYRSRKELGKALKYSQLEVKAAIRSKDETEIAKSRVSELDILYQLIPRPVQLEDVEPLIVKGETAVAYMKENKLEGILPFAQLFLAKFYSHAELYNKGQDLLFQISDSNHLNVVFSKYEQLCEMAKIENDLVAYKKYVLKFRPLAYKTQREFVALNAHNYLLDYYVKAEVEDSALYYAKKLEGNLSKVDTTQFLDYLSISYQLLNHFYQNRNTEKAIRYGIYSNAIDQEIIQSQKLALKELISFKSENQELKNKNSKLNGAFSFIQKNLIVVIVLLVIVLLVLVFGIKRYKRSKKEVHLLLEEKKKIEEKVERSFVLLNNKSKLYLDEILFIKSDGNYVDFHLVDREVTDRNKLIAVLEELPPNFARTHRSYIVNKNFIRSISSQYIHLSNGNEVPLSRTYKDSII